MVVLNIRKNNKNAFAVQVGHHDTVAHAIKAIVRLNDYRLVLRRLADYLEELATLGFQKPQELWGVSFQDVEKDKSILDDLSEEKKAFAFKPKSAPQGFRIVTDKNNRRYGIALTEARAKPLLEITNSIKKRFKDEDELDRLENEEELEGLINELKLQTVMIFGGYEGFPLWEPAYLMMEEKIMPYQLQDQEYPYYQQTAVLWMAGKTLPPDNKLSEHIKNDKSKVRVKLQNPGAAKPAKEAPIDNQTYRNMVKWYHKKNDEFKKLEQNSLQSKFYEGEWTEPKLKQDLTTGGKGISYQPI